jgi:hypothetical protein
VGSDGLATLTIADDGVGFDHKVESKRHGMGLVKRILETVNGTIVLASDRGTRWTMTIPAVPVGPDGGPPSGPTEAAATQAARPPVVGSGQPSPGGRGFKLELIEVDQNCTRV